jgi:anti-anti-sigma factor
MKFSDGVALQAAVVSVEGRVDATTCALLEGHCKRRMTENQRQSLVLDLTEVEYLSSAGLRVILSLGKHAQAAGGKLVLCGVKGPVREIFSIAGFLSLFPVTDTLVHALALIKDAKQPPRTGAPPA